MSDPDTSSQTGTIQQFYEALLKSDTYSAKNLTLFQDNVLKDLLSFVAKHVPFYRERLAPVFHSDGSFEPKNWAKIPILTVAELRANREVFRPTELPASHGRVARLCFFGFHRQACCISPLGPFRSCPERRSLSALPDIQSRATAEPGHDSRLRYDTGPVQACASRPFENSLGHRLVCRWAARNYSPAYGFHACCQPG